jgi:hypothetical protein
MKSKKAVPQKFKDKPTVEAFERLQLSVREGKGRPQRPKPRRGKRNQHGRQHP